MHMRSDMHKIVVERERGGGTEKNRKWGKRLPYAPESDYDEEIRFASSARRRQYGWECKWLSDVLRPLQGYLRKNLGRPWDKVYGELRQGLDVRKVTGMHIFDHVKGMVATDCYVDEKGAVRHLVKDREVTGFFVHLKSGLLRCVARPSRRQRKKNDLQAQQINEIRLDRNTSYRSLEGQWYRVKHQFVRLGPWGQLSDVWDVALRQNVALHQGENRIAVAKRQCSREEIVEVRRRIAEWERRVRRM
jgi:hypothetical protein